MIRLLFFPFQTIISFFTNFLDFYVYVLSLFLLCKYIDAFGLRIRDILVLGSLDGWRYIWSFLFVLPILFVTICYLPYIRCLGTYLWLLPFVRGRLVSQDYIWVYVVFLIFILATGCMNDMGITSIIQMWVFGRVWHVFLCEIMVLVMAFWFIYFISSEVLISYSCLGGMKGCGWQIVFFFLSIYGIWW